MPILLVLGLPLPSPRLLAETLTPTPFSLIPTDGLVKRLEELERTAELYKGGQRLAGVPEACSKDCGGGGRNASLKALGPWPLRILFKKSYDTFWL